MALYLRLATNTFTGLEQSNGKEDPKVFNPAGLDAKQWAAVAKECGFKRIVLTAKDHDGFCLWPTKTTKHSVAASPWRGGKGDVIKEFTAACKDAGIDAGVYLAVEDRNNPAYGTAEYNKIYLAQLAEILTGYGKLAEVRFDGSGGEGSGAAGQPDADAERKKSFDWAAAFALVRKLQPQAIIVSPAGPDAHWNGNNQGHCGASWCTFDPAAIPVPVITTKQQIGILNQGHPGGSVWRPSSTCISMRTNWHWFWHAGEEGQILGVSALMNTYNKSYGRGAAMMLNVPLDKRGLMSEADVARLREFKAALENTFKNDLAAGKKIKETSNGEETALEIDLGAPAQFTTVVLAEKIALGQRVLAYRIEAQDASGQWKELVKGQSIGHRRIETFPATTAGKVRLVIEKSKEKPEITVFSIYGK